MRIVWKRINKKNKKRQGFFPCLFLFFLLMKIIFSFNPSQLVMLSGLSPL
jgi:hypothetical protein